MELHKLCFCFGFARRRSELCATSIFTENEQEYRIFVLRNGILVGLRGKIHLHQ